MKTLQSCFHLEQTGRRCGEKSDRLVIEEICCDFKVIAYIADLAAVFGGDRVCRVHALTISFVRASIRNPYCLSLSRQVRSAMPR